MKYNIKLDIFVIQIHYLLKPILNFIFSLKASVFLLSLLALSMAIGTFVENDYGTEEARIWIYNAWWFEVIFIFLIFIFIFNIFKFKLLRLSKLPVLFLHISFIAILIGAGVTRYISQEGLMLIYEKESENNFFSTEKYFQFKFGFKSLYDNNNWRLDYDLERKLLLTQNPPPTSWFLFPYLSKNKNNWSNKISTNDILDVEYNRYSIGDLSKQEYDNKVSQINKTNPEIKISYHNFIADYESKISRNQFVFKDIITDEITGELKALEFVFEGMNSELILFGEQKEISGVVFTFSDKPIKKFENTTVPYFNIYFAEIDLEDVNKKLFNDNLYYQSNNIVEYMQMQNQSNKGEIKKYTPAKLTTKTLYVLKSINNSNIYYKNKPEEADLLKIKVDYIRNNMKFDTIIDIIGGRTGFQEREVFFSLADDLVVKTSFGSKKVKLPFSVYLDDFQLDYYPGTNAPESYASEVIIDKNKYFYNDNDFVLADNPEEALSKLNSQLNKNLDLTELYQNKKYRIYMNNILEHGGYRFYQSSYGSDENGDYTVLSVNQDSLGTNITYFGYIMLVLSVFSVLFSKKTRFNILLNKLKKIARSTPLFFLILLFCSFSNNQNSNIVDISNSSDSSRADTVIQPFDENSLFTSLNIINPNNPDLFNDLLISASQEDVTKGRIRPFHTRSSELLRKIYGKDKINYIDNLNEKRKINSSQAIISMMLFPNDWYKASIIKLGKHEKLKNLFQTDNKYISYQDFFDNSLLIQFPLKKEQNSLFLSENYDTLIYDKIFSFNNKNKTDINVFYENNILKIRSDYKLSFMVLNDHNNNNYGQTGFVSINDTVNVIEKTAFTITENQETLTFILDIVPDSKDKIIDDYEIAFAKKPHLRSTYDKEILNLQERKSICEYIFSSLLFSSVDSSYNSAIHLNFFPPNVVKYDEDFKLKKLKETQWVVDKIIDTNQDETFFSLYKKLILEQNYNDAEKLVEDLKKYQRTNANLILPSVKKVKSEIFYNKINPFHFSRLVTIYLLLGLFLLISTIIELFYSTKRVLKYIIKSLKIGIYIAFIFHLFFLALRWYISGHAPWSDAYESIIYISFATILSGIVFSRNSNLSLSGSAIVASIFLMVANLNWINPEITNLAPVLNSYWLMIHVSIITSSYGFLALSAFLGFLSLILMLFLTLSNKNKLDKEVNRIHSINERCMMIGLFLLTVGTFLGGVWANESWGRYWGWDPKETWALISVVIYSIVLHIRFISIKRFIYIFSVASVFSFYSIIMTYFGVNFYLSGLHSYAQGDPGPIPNILYYSLIVASLVSIFSLYKHQFIYLSKDNLKRKKELIKFTVLNFALIFIFIRSIFGLL